MTRQNDHFIKHNCCMRLILRGMDSNHDYGIMGPMCLPLHYPATMPLLTQPHDGAVAVKHHFICAARSRLTCP